MGVVDGKKEKKRNSFGEGIIYLLNIIGSNKKLLKPALNGRLINTLYSYFKIAAFKILARSRFK